MNTAPPSSSALRELASVVRGHGWLLLVVAVHALGAAAVYFRHPTITQFGLLLEGYVASLLMGPVFALCGYAIYVMLFIRPHRLLRFLAGTVRTHLSRRRLLHALPALLLLPVFASSFTIIKAAVPEFQLYAWDARLAALDQVLHGGVQPWIWLQSMLGHPVLTALLNLVYHLWFFIMFAMVYWMVFSTARPQLRMQFLLGFMLSWIVLGNGLAILFSSAGPCYYHLVQDGTNPYAALMSYLHGADRQIPVLALEVQKLLWQGYQQKLGVSGLAIAAMPSMHVASSVLLALLGWRLNRHAGIALTLFAVLIMLGSVHLGWHYAVDGYAGAIGAWLLWRLAGWLHGAGAGDGAAPAALPPSLASATHQGPP